MYFHRDHIQLLHITEHSQIYESPSSEPFPYTLDYLFIRGCFSVSSSNAKPSLPPAHRVELVETSGLGFEAQEQDGQVEMPQEVINSRKEISGAVHLCLLSQV